MKLQQLTNILKYTNNIRILNEYAFKEEAQKFKDLHWQIKTNSQETNLLSGFNQRVQMSTWFSNFISDFNDRNVLSPSDFGYKRVHLLLRREWHPKHICNVYESIIINAP